ncbi:helix-turn-helix domain-containing protein [Candidatus Finniella inopinata]|nr:helix-turn-helix domain-containing protein [Candidatus Finniella inopinata]
METTTGQRLIDSLQEALDYAKGSSTREAKVSHVERLKKIEIPDLLNAKEIREQLKMSQAEFSARFGINLNTLRNWEHGRRAPDLATKSYLYAISRNAELVEKALHS